MYCFLHLQIATKKAFSKINFQKQPCNVFNIFIIWAYKLAITYALLKMLLKQNAIKAKNVDKGNKYILNNLIVSNNNKYGFIR